ncbi:Short-chain dehydrogenase/reductase SDR [Penicillium expansum]|nr:Short-chain dehydrogenase/reductase SDR [Penicillium expansum]
MAFPPSAGFTWISKIHNDTYPTITATRWHRPRDSDCIRSSRCLFHRTRSKILLDAVETAVLDAAKSAGHPPPQILKLALDVSDEQSVSDAAAEVKRAFSSLDILVNNAGRVEKWVPLAETDPKSWWSTWEVNFTSVEYAAQGVLAFAIHPGAVDTELASRLPEDEGKAGGLARILWLAGRYLSATWDVAELMARKEEIVQGDKLKVKLVL